MKTNEQIAEQLVKDCGITAPYDSLKKMVVDALEMKEQEMDWQSKYELLECRLKDTEERERIGKKIINELREKNNELEKMYRKVLSALTIDCQEKAISFIK